MTAYVGGNHFGKAGIIYYFSMDTSNQFHYTMACHDKMKLTVNRTPIVMIYYYCYYHCLKFPCIIYKNVESSLHVYVP